MKLITNLYLLILMKLHRIIFNKMILQLDFEPEEFPFPTFGKLLESFFVFSLIENIKMCYGSIDKKFSLEHKLYFSNRHI